VKLARAFPVFSIAFVVIYAFAVDYNLALFTYHPQLRQFAFLVEAPKAGPAMYWYGWIVTSALGAAVVAVLALALPRSWVERIWSGWTWLVPVAVIIFFVNLLKGYFLR
jgi:hypothetical protein